MHRLLQRQLKKNLPDSLAGSEELRLLLDSISNAYIDYERDYLYCVQTQDGLFGEWVYAAEQVVVLF
jgi:hypothetical protein